MSLHFILDGYNLLMRSPQFRRDLDKDDIGPARQKFLQFLEYARPQGSLRNRVTVVFDGRSDVVGDWRQKGSSTVRIIFTEDETADEKILRLVEQVEDSQQTIVVTDDRELSHRVSARGVKVIAVSEFLRKKERSSQQREREDQSGLDPKEAQRITEELARHWLKK